ncbi:MAG: hypothetical protein FWD71_06685 [Oscillospiraceae bacterium]|nr:hypothetical protein [Oscillospiraceae bacterium]
MSKKTFYLLLAIIVVMFFTRIYTSENETDSNAALKNSDQTTDEPTLQTEDTGEYTVPGYQYTSDEYSEYNDYNVDINSNSRDTQSAIETFTDLTDFPEQDTTEVYNYDTTESNIESYTDYNFTDMTDITDITSLYGTTDQNITDITNFTNITVPYTLDEIKSIFDESRNLFEQIKDLCLSSGYNTTIYIADTSSPPLPGITGPGIYYRAAGQNDYMDINQIDGHEAITELFDKYNILGVSSYDYTDHYTHIRESGVVFQMLSCAQYEQDIVYSESAEVTDEVTNENTAGTMQLDTNWHYERINHQ